MWIWLDRYGKVKEYLTHGMTPVVGDTMFQIFAYFDGLDIDTVASARIKLGKPDRQRNFYPGLYMTKAELTFEREPEDSRDTRFQENTNYKGFIFDFSNFLSGDIVKLLDTPGLWSATISLTMADNPGRIMSSGLITFDVGRAVGDEDSEDQTEMDISEVIENLNAYLIANYVPYTGANKNVNVGTHQVIAKNTEDSSKEIAYGGDGISVIEHGAEGEEDTVYNLELPNKSGTLATLDDLPPGGDYLTAEDHDYVIPPEDR